MKSVSVFDDGECDVSPEFSDAEDHRKEEEIMENRRYNTRESDTLPDLGSLPPWAYEDGDRQAIRECNDLMSACKFGLARLHLAVWAIITHGDRGTNGTIRFVAWTGRDYEVTSRPVDADGNLMSRTEEGVPSYWVLAAQYGVARCTIERAYEHFVDAVLPYTRNGAYGKIDRVLQNRMVHDLGTRPHPADRCDWLEELWWSMGDLNEVLVRRCPTTRAGRDPVRAMAYRLVNDGRVAANLAESFRIPNCQTSETLVDEYTAVETVVGCDSMKRIMTLLAETLA